MEEIAQGKKNWQEIVGIPKWPSALLEVTILFIVSLGPSFIFSLVSWIALCLLCFGKVGTQGRAMITQLCTKLRLLYSCWRTKRLLFPA